MDVAGDENDNIMKARKVRTWDRKKRRYVTNFVGGDPYRKQRNEAGELISPKNGPRLYEKWQKKHHKAVNMPEKIQTVEDDVEGSSAAGKNKKRKRDDIEGGGSRGARGGRGGCGGRGGSGTGKGRGGRGAKSELKSADAIRKQRITKERRTNYLKSKKRGGRK